MTSDDGIEARIGYYANYRIQTDYWIVDVCGLIYWLFHDSMLVRVDGGDPGDESD